jgi:hypothetical protein
MKAKAPNRRNFLRTTCFVAVRLEGFSLGAQKARQAARLRVFTARRSG